ncbi:MAG: hypothetical protein KGK34_01605 [Chloroflexota bacterium]|nr:hypothetical protein [Chloroflexota bacterium]
MLALLRLVARSTAYREHSTELLSRQPDDVWFQDDVWVLTFALMPGASAERLLVFGATASGENSMSLRHAALVDRTTDGSVTVEAQG